MPGEAAPRGCGTPSSGSRTWSSRHEVAARVEKGRTRRCSARSSGSRRSGRPGLAAPRVHHLNCGTMCPRGRRLVNGDGSFIADGRVVCHVLLIEAPDGLVLVDTGFGTADITNP